MWWWLPQKCHLIRTQLAVTWSVNKYLSWESVIGGSASVWLFIVVGRVLMGLGVEVGSLTMLGHGKMVWLVHCVLIRFFNLRMCLIDFCCFISWILKICLMLVLPIFNWRRGLWGLLLVLLWLLTLNLISMTSIGSRIGTLRCHTATSHIAIIMLKWRHLIWSCDIFKYAVFSNYRCSAINRS